jgi:putative SOS response-associated peptidase YedK
VRPVHDRMPVILDPEVEAAWLEPDTDVKTLLGFLLPAPDDALVMRDVSDAVNDVRQDGAHLIAPRDEQGELF